jgi:hypothetical protein
MNVELLELAEEALGSLVSDVMFEAQLRKAGFRNGRQSGVIRSWGYPGLDT